jgi:hypothetical protein
MYIETNKLPLTSSKHLFVNHFTTIPPNNHSGDEEGHIV